MGLKGMKEFLKGAAFLVGWVLSPLTWWNDAFVNIPLSYLIANIVFYCAHIPLGWTLLIGIYWFTNILGLCLMYLSGRSVIVSSRHKIKATVFLIVFTIIFTVIAVHLEKRGKLMPIGVFFGKPCATKTK